MMLVTRKHHDAEIARLTAELATARQNTNLAWGCRDRLKAENEKLRAQLAPFTRRERGAGGKFAKVGVGA